MPHELMDKLGLIATTLRYQCPCEGREVIALTVMFDRFDFADEEKFVEVMKIARRDMVTEIAQHAGRVKLPTKPRLP